MNRVECTYRPDVYIAGLTDAGSKWCCDARWMLTMINCCYGCWMLLVRSMSGVIGLLPGCLELAGTAAGLSGVNRVLHVVSSSDGAVAG